MLDKKYFLPVYNPLLSERGFNTIDHIGLNPGKCLSCSFPFPPDYLDIMDRVDDYFVIVAATLCPMCESIYGPPTFKMQICTCCNSPIMPRYPDSPYTPGYMQYLQIDNELVCGFCYEEYQSECSHSTLNDVRSADADFKPRKICERCRKIFYL